MPRNSPNTQDASVLRIVRDANIHPSTMQVLRVRRDSAAGKAGGRAHHYCTHPLHPGAAYVKVSGPCFQQLAQEGAAVLDMSRADFLATQGQRVGRPLRMPRGFQPANPGLYTGDEDSAQEAKGAEAQDHQDEAGVAVAASQVPQEAKGAEAVLEELRRAWQHGLPGMILSSQPVLRAQAVTRLEAALGAG